MPHTEKGKKKRKEKEKKKGKPRFQTSVGSQIA
jgi:hypothetical protein